MVRQLHPLVAAQLETPKESAQRKPFVLWLYDGNWESNGSGPGWQVLTSCCYQLVCTAQEGCDQENMNLPGEHELTLKVCVCEARFRQIKSPQLEILTAQNFL